MTKSLNTTCARTFFLYAVDSYRRPAFVQTGILPSLSGGVVARRIIGRAFKKTPTMTEECEKDSQLTSIGFKDRRNRIRLNLRICR